MVDNMLLSIARCVVNQVAGAISVVNASSLGDYCRLLLLVFLNMTIPTAANIDGLLVL